MKFLLILFFCIQYSNGFSQVDTIFTNNERIPCRVTEVTQDAVKFSYTGEDLTNTIYKNTVQRIVFKSGRVQSFSEATSYKKVTGPDDVDNVSLTQVESEIKGLFKLGEVSSKAVGTTVMSSIVKVKERATKKLKIQAAMMGANIVYVTQNGTIGNQGGTRYQAGHATTTNLSGVAYSNILPDYQKFIQLIGNKRNFRTIVKYKLSGSDPDIEKTKFEKKIEILNIRNENGLIMLDTKIEKVHETSFRVINFSEREFTIVVKDGQKIYNYIIEL